MAERTGMLSWLQIGDLHITRADHDDYRDLLRILPGGDDFKPLEPAGQAWSGADRVGAWPENGIIGTQLSQNRSGRTWW